VGSLAQLCEDIRDAVDERGGHHCFAQSVSDYHQKTGLPMEGLWAVVNAVIEGVRPAKIVKRLMKSHGGTAEEWLRWLAIAKTKPDCS